MSLDPREIGQRIKAARERRGWTQLQFALEASVSPSTTARWESGSLPPVRELIRVAGILGVPADELVESPAVNGAMDSARLDRLEARVEEALELLHEVRDRVLAQPGAKPAARKGTPRARPGN